MQAIGQASEIGFLPALPLFFRTVGIKGVLLGMAGWAAHYLMSAHAFTAAGPIPPLVVIALALHGVCLNFFVAGRIYIDKRFRPRPATAPRASWRWSPGVWVRWRAASAPTRSTSRASAGRPTLAHDLDAPAVLAVAVGVVFALAFRDRRAEPATLQGG